MTDKEIATVIRHEFLEASSELNTCLRAPKLNSTDVAYWTGVISTILRIDKALLGDEE